MVVKGLVMGAIAGAAVQRQFKPGQSLLGVFGHELAAPEPTAMDRRRNTGGRHSREWIEHKPARPRHRQNKTLDEPDRELAWMPRLLYVVALDVGDVPDVLDILPDVFRVLAQRIAGNEALLRSLEMLLARIFRGDPDGIKIEIVIVGVDLAKKMDSRYFCTVNPKEGVMSKRFSEQFKQEAVQLVSAERPIRQVASYLGIGYSTLDKWVRAHRERTGQLVALTQEQKRIRELERQVAHLQEVNDILKKATVYFANPANR